MSEYDDPWAVPAATGWSQGEAPAGPGWGAPPEAPRPRPRPAWVVPVAVIVAFALGVLGTGLLLRQTAKPQRTPPRAAPAPTTKAPTTAPRKPAPTATKAAPPAPPVPAPTYSAPPDGIPVRGRVVDANGRPVGDATVSMSRHEGFFEGFGRALIAVGSLGLACIGTEFCTVPYGEGRTDSGGGYTVFLKAEVDDYDVTVRRGGTTYAVRIDFAGKPLRLPEVVLWSPSPRLDQNGTTARVRFNGAPARAGTVDGYDATITAGNDGDAVLSLDGVRSGDTFDARLIEDVSGTLNVSAQVRTRLGKATYTGTVPVHGRFRPMSRGRSCLEYGNARTVRTSPCGLTDGNLGKDWGGVASTKVCKPNTSCDQSVAVDLGGVRSIHYVSVHGCNTFFDEVESSTDGRRWRTLIPEGGSSEGCYAAVSGVARYVRVRGAFYSSRREISVF
jgi:hypothetical protein